MELEGRAQAENEEQHSKEDADSSIEVDENRIGPLVGATLSRHDATV
jgi:hypothetical protein